MTLVPGAQLGPYEILASIGAGGMGEVYRAVDSRLGRTVAIKILTGTEPESNAQRRFLQEARAASALNHPNIVIVHDICSHQGVDFLVMEHIQGQTLEDLIPAEGLPLETVARIGEQIASALEAAHSAGIVHRDIKPANVMITTAHQVKVLDFGIAKMAVPIDTNPYDNTLPAGQITTPGMIVGTVAYMSPEQARGEALDQRSDLFSLGCVLYETATGRRPFRGETALMIMHEIAVVTQAAPSTLRPELPAAFDRLISACLAKSPDQRPGSAAQIARDLKSLASPDRISIRAPDGRRALAVLPFQFRTSIAEDQFLSVALADALIHRLTSSEALLVRPMASVMRYAGKEIECAQAARDLNVDLVVEGTIQKAGARIRVLVHAQRVADCVSLHSEKFDGSMEDLFDLQDRIVDSVSDALIPESKASAEAAQPPTRNPQAYELYLRATDRILQLDNFDMQVAIEMLNRAIELDPDFTDAWGRLAQAYTQMAMHLDPDPQWFDRAERAIARTLELDPVHYDALCARGLVLWTPSRGFQHRPALRALNASLRLRPGNESAHQFRGAILFHLGFYNQALRDTEAALLVNPGHVMSFLGMGMIAQYRGDYETACELMDRSLFLNPSGVHANLFSAVPAILVGRMDLAVEKIRKARLLFPDEPQLIAQQGLVLAHEGNFLAAEEMADQAVAGKRSLTHTHHGWHDAAGVYSLCGKPQKAIALLRRCAEFGLPNYLLFQSDPHLQALRGHPAFQELMSALRRDHDAYREEFGFTR
jgi:serine/threonine protein kinase/Flp pilus assembly protein TadD